MTIDRTNFLTDGFLQIIQRTGFFGGETRDFKSPPKRKKSHVERSRERGGPRQSLNKRVVHKHVVINGPSVSIATDVNNTEEKNADHLVPRPSAYLRSTTHSNNVKFQGVTLYKFSVKTNSFLLSKCR